MKVNEYLDYVAENDNIFILQTSYCMRFCIKLTLTNRLSFFRHLNDEMFRRRHFDLTIPYPRFVQM